MEIPTGRCCDNGEFGQQHQCQKQPSGEIMPAMEPPKRRRGRPRGVTGLNSRMPSAIAQAFKANGLDWKADFADAIKRNKRERIKLWLRLLPYMITTNKPRKVGKWKGRPSKAALIALEHMESGE